MMHVLSLETTLRCVVAVAMPVRVKSQFPFGLLRPTAWGEELQRNQWRPLFKELWQRDCSTDRLHNLISDRAPPPVAFEA